jgi:CubicO group peptidase (beta-lactamase class C family)
MATTVGTVGEYFWGGLAGTVFWVAPGEELFAMMMIQAPVQRDYYRYLFRNLVYAALD